MASLQIPMLHLMLMFWKNLRMRMHYSIIAILEFFFPIVVFHVGLNFHSILMMTAVRNGTEIHQQRQTEMYEPFKNCSVTIVFSPENEFTIAIINAVKDKIGPAETIGVSDDVVLKSMFMNRSFTTNRNELSEWKAFGISFSSDVNDLQFRYTIHTFNSLLNKDTSRLFSQSFTVPTNKEDEYLTTGFLGLQFALDSTYVKMKSKKETNLYEITIEKFPYSVYVVGMFPEDIIYILTLLGFIFLALTVPYYIATERYSGMKEMMKIMGLSEVIISFGWMTYSLMIYPIVITIIVIMLKTNLSTTPFYRNIDAVLLWMIFILYCIANMTFLFSIGTLLNKHWVAIVTSVVISFITASPWLRSKTYEYDGEGVRIMAFVLLCFIPNLVLFNAFKALQYFEMKGNYTGWSSLVTDIRDPQIHNLRTIIIYFITNIILNSIIIVYINLILPGRYGYRKHPFFIFTWFVEIFSKDEKLKFVHEDELENEYMETTDNKRLSIQIRNLEKHFNYFSPFSALKDINLNILKNEITVILGHNGAGKTTLLNVISGMVPRTSGDILYHDREEIKDFKEFNGKLGFCTQHTIYFNYLTVEEHIIFCGMARGLSELKAIRESNNLLSLFNMQEKSHNMVHELSGGMRKKLILLMALIGRPEVLILDEPTSGMDVYSRHITWNLLKKLKENCTIMITTQDMEEADVIGDRIAIMHDGQIFCYGSPLFLKSVFETGYNLILTKGPNYNTDNTTKIIKQIVPSASIVKDSSTVAKYNLPLSATSTFSSLFQVLEHKQLTLGITEMKMYCTTMDQVFVSGTFLAGRETEKPIASSLPRLEEVTIELLHGVALTFHQLVALFLKKFKLMYRRYIRFFFCIFLALILGLTNITIIDLAYLVLNSRSHELLNLSLSVYPNAEVMIFRRDKNVTGFMNTYAQYVLDKDRFPTIYENVNVTKGVSEFSKRNYYEFHDNVVAAVEMTNDEHNVLYNELIPHSAPVSLNTYSNALLRYLTKNTSLSIEATYLPISISSRETYCGTSQKYAYFFAGFWWIFIFFSAIVGLFVFLISFIISERVHGIKHIQTMSNLPEITYWLGNYIFDCCVYVIWITIIICLMTLTDTYGIFPFHDMKILYSALILFGVSGLLYCYVFASLFESISIFMLINVIVNVSCLFWFIRTHFEGSSVFHSLQVLSILLPPFAFLNILAEYLYILLNNNQCVYCMDWERPLCESKSERLIMDIYTASPWGIKFHSSIENFMSYLILDVFIYIPLLILVNSTFMAWLWNSFIAKVFGKNAIIDQDELKERNYLVQSEKERVKEIYEKNKSSDHALLVYKLQKNLILNGFFKFTPVVDINFLVSKGSCFGIAGMNGAGKSTMMKVLTAFLLPTVGDAKAYDISMRKELRKYVSMIGSCPQSNPIFEELTGKEMLLLIATLRGLKNPEKHVKKWILTFDLEKYQDNLAETYSTGSKRKLCTALSLIGDPFIVFLDEPATGIDPLARQILYKIIKNRKRDSQAILVATHSLKECETLCDRVTILQNGIIKFIGTVTSLNQYAVGYTLLIKYRNEPNYYEKIDTLVAAVLKVFKNDDCHLKDQQVGFLHFRILNKEILWSAMFGTMENIKKQHTMVEEYTLTNTSIEEIFVSPVKNIGKKEENTS